VVLGQAGFPQRTATTTSSTFRIRHRHHYAQCPLGTFSGNAHEPAPGPPTPGRKAGPVPGNSQTTELLQHGRMGNRDSSAVGGIEF